jgi:outer membrane lipoprotein-sorting protein
MISTLLIVLSCMFQFEGDVQGDIGGIRTLLAHFERRVVNKTGVEKTVGTIFYRVPDILHIATTKPVRQHLLVHDRTMTIYYPSENKAFVITSERQMELPFVSAFFLGLHKDYGLSELQYQMENYQLCNDTLHTRWKRRGSQEKPQERVFVSAVGQRIVSVEIQDSTTQTWSKLVFDEFVRTPGGTWLGIALSIRKKLPTGTYRESIVLRDVEFNIPFPDSISYFQIPPNTNIQDIDW